MGFSHFLSLPMLQVDKSLLMALVEGQSPTTHTFHLLMGEIGIPLIDFFMMTGLSMDGTPPPSSEDFDLALVARCIEPQSVTYYKGMKGILPSWFQTDYVQATDQSFLLEIAFSTRTFLIYMLTLSIFCMKSDQVYFYLLLALEDLDLVATHSWGRFALGWMYSNMSEISSGQSPHAFVGLYFLWDVLFTSPLFQFLSFILTCVL